MVQRSYIAAELRYTESQASVSNQRFQRLMALGLIALSIAGIALWANQPQPANSTEVQQGSALDAIPAASATTRPPDTPAPTVAPAAAPIADFAAPLPSAEAQRRVEEARASEAQARAAIARQLNPTSAERLPRVQTVFVPETGFHLSDRSGFLSFWRANGSTLIFGYPISNEQFEDGRVVQYFERARFEYHPANPPGQRVVLSLAGSILTQGRTFPAGAPDAGERYFPETSHTLSGRFLRFWEKRGGLALFGYPISEPFEEASPIDGQTRIVQYFERARFEWHPEELGGFYQQQASALGLNLLALREVSLGDLGRQLASQQGRVFSPTAQLGGAPALQPVLWQRRIEVDLTRQWLTAYEGDTAVYRAPVATGRDGFNTPTGEYAIYLKYPIQTMVGDMGGETWHVPDIPWVQYIVGGVAFHGTYWHDAWGTGVRMSHGCVNLNIDDAQWLYEWADIGTSVSIHY